MPREIKGTAAATQDRRRPAVHTAGGDIIPEVSASTPRLARLRLLLDGAIERTATTLERRAVLVLGGFLLALYLPLSMCEAHWAPLTHDEIFTAYIAQAPDLPSLLALRREIDMHPPLHYLLEREALRLPISREISARLPNILAGLATAAGLFFFTARWLGPLAGFVAAAVFWFGPLPEFAWQNRPYMLWYALLAALMLAWSRATERRRPPWLLPVVAALAVLLALTHLFGLACLFPFAAAEWVRARRNGRADWRLLIALGVPLPLAGLALFQLRSMGAHNFSSINLPNVGLLGRIYFHTVDDLFVVFGVCAVCLGLLTVGRHAPAGERGPATRAAIPFSRPSRERSLPIQVTTLLVALLLLPAPLMVAGSLAHIQFWDRYGYFVVLPLAVLLARLVLWVGGRHARGFAVLATAALFAGAAARFAVDRPLSAAARAAAAQPGLPPQRLDRLDPALPIVAASPMTFVEMSDRESHEIAARTWYLTDHAAALRFSGDTLFDNEEKIRTDLHLSSHTLPCAPFVAAHSRFYLVASFTTAEEWLPRALLASGSHLQYLGKFASTYVDDDLYLVTRPDSSP